MRLLVFSLMCLPLLGQSPLTFRAEIDGKEWRPALSERMRLGDLEVTRRVTQESGAWRTSAVLRNSGSQPLRLGRVTLAERTVAAGTRLLAMTGWQIASRVRTVERGTAGKPGLVVSKVVTEFREPEGRHTVAGFVTFDRIATQHELVWTAEAAQPSVRSLCDFEGWSLRPGQSVESEELWLADGARLDEWTDLAADKLKPRFPDRAPAGWVGWSWVDPFNVERYEDVVLRNAQAVRDRLPGTGIDTLWVSLGNLKDRRPGDWLSWNEQSFPSGPQGLVAKLNALDFKFGLWCGAFWLNSALKEDVARLRPALLQKDGKLLAVPHRDLGEMYILDPTHPLTQERLRQVFRTYREWGVRYYMIDFLDSVSGSTPGTYRPSGYADRGVIPGPAPLRQGLKAIREAAGEDTFLLASTGPSFWSAGLLQGARAGSDYGEGRPLDGLGKGFWPGTFMLNNPQHWTSHRVATDGLASHAPFHRKLFWADTANVLTVGAPLPLADAQISTTIFGLNGGQIMLGDDVARLTEERVRLLRMVFPRLPEAARSLDLFDTPEPDYPKFFHLPVKTAWDQWDLYAVFNYGREPLTQTIPLVRPSIAWDFWNERDLGAVSGAWPVTVPAGSVRLLRVSAFRPHPWLAGTNLHVRQGQSEVDEVRWDAAANRLTVRYHALPKQEGSLFLHAPAGWSVRTPAGLGIGKDANDGALIIAIPVRGDARTVTVDFAPPASAPVK